MAFRVVAGIRMRPAEILLLATIRKIGFTKFSDLSSSIFMEDSDLINIIKSLEAKGVLVYDRRRREVVLTPQGERASIEAERMAEDIILDAIDNGTSRFEVAPYATVFPYLVEKRSIDPGWAYLKLADTEDEEEGRRILEGELRKVQRSQKRDSREDPPI